jgi:hypothetical protein
MPQGDAFVLRPGDRVSFDDGDHQVVALSGTSVRLRSSEGAEMVVPASCLMASAGFAVSGTDMLPELEPSGLLSAVPEAALATAQEWERHVVEVETGLPPDAVPGAAPRPEYDPDTHSPAERDAAKAAELGVGVRTVQGRRYAYARQGLWGLVDQRTTRLSDTKWGGPMPGWSRLSRRPSLRRLLRPQAPVHG